MEKFDYKKLFIQAVKEGIEEHQPGEKKFQDFKEEIFDGQKKGRYKKVVAATQLLLELVPDKVSEKIKSILDNQDYDKLPFDFDQYDFREKIGKGFVSKVHLLQAKEEGDPSYVVKIGYNQTGSVEELQNIAQSQHTEYEKIRETYKDIDEFIPDELSMITTDKKNNKPVIATVQEYLGKNMRDFFSEIRREELQSMLEKNESFRNEFMKFSEITLRIAEEKNEIIDLVGNKNLSVIEKNKEPHLLFIDPHHISSVASDDKNRIEKLQKALTYIEEIRNELNGVNY
jgi:hypothetical protein